MPRPRGGVPDRSASIGVEQSERGQYVLEQHHL